MRCVVLGELTIKGDDEAGRAHRQVPRDRRQISSGNERIGLELEGTIDRTEFGLEWNAPLPGGGFLLPNDVTLQGDLRGGEGCLR